MVVWCRSCNKEVLVHEETPFSYIELNDGTRYWHAKADTDLMEEVK